MTSFSESILIRVYYEDTDFAGVVYYANYLKYMERARTEFLRTAGLELDVIDRDYGVLFAVTEANIRYHASAVFNDVVRVESSISRLRGTRITFRQQIFRQSDHQLLTSADIHLACISRENKAKRLPSQIRTILSHHLQESS